MRICSPSFKVDYLRSIVALLALLIACLSRCDAQPATPHILFIVVDDLGWNGPLHQHAPSFD
jgi:hypothetical protein